jgi:hypothetical protein
VAWTQFVAELYELFGTDTNHLGHLTKLKQYGTVKEFIAAFERLTFHKEGMSDSFFQEFFISGLNEEICAHVLMDRPQSMVEDTKRTKNNRMSILKLTKPHLFLALNQTLILLLVLH